MEDAELFRALQPTPRERSISRAGSFAGFGLAFVFFAGWLHKHWELDDSSAEMFALSVVLNLFLGLGGAILSLIIATVVSLPFTMIADLRAKPMRRELQRRYGLAGEDYYVEQAGAHEEVVLFVGRVLPHGGGRVIEIDLPEGRLEVRAAKELDPEKVFRGSALLDASAVERLRAALAARFSAPIEDPTPTVIDGYPASVFWLRRGLPVVKAAANLAGEDDHPTLELLRLIVELERSTTGAEAHWSGTRLE